MARRLVVAVARPRVVEDGARPTAAGAEYVAVGEAATGDEAIEVGQPADLILFDTEAETTFTKGFMKSKSQNTPFIDQTLKGRVDLVVLGTEILLER